MEDISKVRLGSAYLESPGPEVDLGSYVHRTFGPVHTADKSDLEAPVSLCKQSN